MMTEFDEAADQRARFAALNHEIYNLTKQLEAKEREYLDSTKTDLYDPFKNPTEFRWYRDDYSEILPWVTMPEFSVPFEPAKVEKAAIRRFYNIGGLTVLFQFIASILLSIGLVTAVRAALSSANPNAAEGAISHYMNGSSIVAAINMLTYLTVNVGFAFIGLKWAKIKPSFMIKTKDFGFGDAIQYCFSGVFIWLAAAYVSSGVEDVFSKYGFTTDVMDTDFGKTGIGFAVMTIYVCIIAPVTEEVFFRGALMKIFSKADQRFGIIASAVFFGLAHGNLPQFLLAFLMGMFFGHIDMRHNSIVPSVVVHILINTLSTVMGEIAGNTIIMAGVSMILFISAFVGLGFLITFRMKCKFPVSTPAQSRRGFALAKTSIGCILAFGVQFIYLSLLILATKK